LPGGKPLKGSKKVIDAMNGLLAAELAAMDQYFIHSEMYEDWGLTK
jgi:bacterioferritin